MFRETALFWIQVWPCQKDSRINSRYLSLVETLDALLVRPWNSSGLLFCGRLRNTNYHKLSRSATRTDLHFVSRLFCIVFVYVASCLFFCAFTIHSLKLVAYVQCHAE